MAIAYVGLGSNMGDAEGHLSEARRELRAIPGVKVSGCSSIYRTEPQGRADQPWFRNQVVKLCCSGIDSVGLLDAMLAAETRLGRVRVEGDHFGPRVIDMDLLLYGDEVRTGDPHLILPHPRMQDRAFVLVPLLELDAELKMPGGTPCSELLARLCHRVEGHDIFQ